jgi:hypothetical protein
MKTTQMFVKHHVIMQREHRVQGCKLSSEGISMKKLATLKAAPLAAAVVMALSSAAPVAASAEYHHDDFHPVHSGNTWLMPMNELLALPIHQPMENNWTMQHEWAQPVSTHKGGVVDSFAATVTLVHIEVVATSSGPKEAKHYQNNDYEKHDAVKASHYEHDKKVEHHTKSDSKPTSWQHNGVTYHHADDHKPYDHKDEDCWKDDSHDPGKYKVVWHDAGYWDYERSDWQGHHNNHQNNNDWSHDNSWKHDNNTWSHDQNNQHDWNKDEHHNWHDSQDWKHQDSNKYDHAADWSWKEESKDHNDWKHNSNNHWEDSTWKDDSKHHESKHDEWNKDSHDWNKHSDLESKHSVTKANHESWQSKDDCPEEHDAKTAYHNS